MAYIGNKPANKAIVASDLDPAVITGQTALATSPADTDEFLISDAGVLKRLDASLIGGGAFTLLSTATVSSAVSEVDITSNIDSTYKNYMFILTDVKSASDNVRFKIQYFSSSGSPDTGSVYMYAGKGLRSDNVNIVVDSTGNTTGDISIAACSVDAGHRHSQFVLYLFNPSGTDSYKQMTSTAQQTVADDKAVSGLISNTYKRTVAVTGIRFKMASGNITRGTFKLYGIS